MNCRVLIVADHASAKFGGEAALPFHYFRVLKKRNHPVWLVVHERTRKELEAHFPNDQSSIYYIHDTRLHQFLFRVGKFLPQRITYLTTGFLLRLVTQFAQRRMSKKLVRELKIDVVHQPMPVSPKEPSMLFGLNAPVVIGPMNGGMNFPVGFRHMQSRFVDWSVVLGRLSSSVINRIVPGKRHAMLVVANPRTRAALPNGSSQQIFELVENGIDLTLWRRRPGKQTHIETNVIDFVYMGRLVSLKAVDLLLEAFRIAANHHPISLRIIGDGPCRKELETQAKALNLYSERSSECGKVFFPGWLSQEECARQLVSVDALVLPSLHECGGAVILEAMSAGLPVIATAWGGPLDYLDETCGILVPPLSTQKFVDGLADAISRISESHDLRKEMGAAGRAKVEQFFDWETKVDRMLEIYQRAISDWKKSLSSVKTTNC